MANAARATSGGATTAKRPSVDAASSPPATATTNAPAPGPAQRGRRGRKAKIYVHIPWLDNLLTFVFITQTLWAVWAFSGNRKDLLRFFGSIVFTAIAVVVVKKVSGVVGKAVSDLLPWRPLAKAVNVRKFGEQSWQLVAHVLLAAADWFVIWGEPWYEDTTTFFIPHPMKQEVPASLRMVFMFQLGLWVYTCIVHRWFDKPRRKDYFIMFAHHVVTIGLVSGAGVYGFWRAGTVILAIHDTSDILVDLLKIVNFLQLEGPRRFFITEITFVANLVVWIYFRLWIFPSRILYAGFIQMHYYLQPEGKNPYPGQPWKDFFNIDVSMYYPGNIMLNCLFLMHIWWTFLFLRIAYKLLFSADGGHQAGREEYEGDSEIEGQSTGPETEPDAPRRRAAKAHAA